MCLFRLPVVGLTLPFFSYGGSSIVTLFAAIFDSSASHALFATCLLATVAIPLLIWIYTWMFGKLTNRSTFADFHPEEKENENK